LLDKTDWAKLWMQVIHELRNGVKLRKVCEKPYEIRRRIEYELTPFEILLDQIRARKYHLKKVSLDTSLAPQVKKDARDIILEFIRSRPPLKKSSQRKLANKILAKTQQLPNLHEQLMMSIRNYSIPLRKTQINMKSKSLDQTTHDSTTADSSMNKIPKRLLKVDKKLLNKLASSDDVSLNQKILLYLTIGP
jgi:spire-like protein